MGQIGQPIPGGSLGSLTMGQPMGQPIPEGSNGSLAMGKSGQPIPDGSWVILNDLCHLWLIFVEIIS